MGNPKIAPTFAAYCPEAALDDFDQCQRRDPRYALLRLSERAAAAGRELRIVVLTAGSWRAAPLRRRFVRAAVEAGVERAP